METIVFNKQTIKEMVVENRQVEIHARRLEKLFLTRVVIGGSYALKYQLRNFWNREVSDYDFIVYPRDEADRVRILRMLATMKDLGLIHGGYYGEYAYKFGWLMGKQVEVLVSDKFAGGIVSMYESPQRIKEVKECWVLKFKNKGLEPREKDIEDIAKIEEELLVDLPW